MQNDNYEITGRKATRLKQRPNLEITAQVEQGRSRYVVKDPVALRYYQLEETQHFILTHMDGSRTLEEVRQAYESQFRPQRLTLEEVESFAGHLLQCGLIESTAASAGVQLLKRQRKGERERRWARATQIFYWKLPLANPTRALNGLSFVGVLLFHPLTLLLSFGLLLASVTLLATHWEETLSRFAKAPDLFGWKVLLALWLTMGCVKILHELGHALLCRKLGGEVTEFGIVFLFFMPTLYCDVTDCWKMPQRWKRMLVAAAGIYVELLLAALAVLVWWASEPTSIVHLVAASVMVICGLNTLLLNGNPLMRFDGYFILSDWLAIPNLGTVAQRQLRYRVLSYLGVSVTPPAETSRPTLLACYAAASLCYRWVILGGIICLVHAAAVQARVPWLGLLASGMILALLLARPLYQFGRFLWQLASGVVKVRLVRLLPAGVLVAGLLAAAWLVPFSRAVYATGLLQVEPEHHRRLLVPGAGGFVERLLVHNGSQVRKGDVLAVLVNPDLERQIRLLETDIALRREEQRAHAVQRPLGVSGAALAKFEQAERTTALLLREHQHLVRQNAALVLRAPCDGIVLGKLTPELHGKWLEPGTELLAVGDQAHIRVLIVFNAGDRKRLEKGSALEFLGRGERRIRDGVVTEIARLDATSIPPALAQRVGGDVPTRSDADTRSEKPHKQHYLVTAQLAEHAQLALGTLGRVRIATPPTTLFRHAQRWFHEVIR